VQVGAGAGLPHKYLPRVSLQSYHNHKKVGRGGWEEAEEQEGEQSEEVD
jgi:hypothetical protein